MVGLAEWAMSLMDYVVDQLFELRRLLYTFPTLDVTYLRPQSTVDPSVLELPSLWY